MSSTTTDHTIAVLRHVFAAYGLPEQIVSNIGPQFTSQEFADFLRSNGVTHVRSAPLPPFIQRGSRMTHSNIQAVNEGRRGGWSVTSASVAEFLLTHRSTPHATTGLSPASLFLGRPIRTRFDLLHPDVGRRTCAAQARQKSYHDGFPTGVRSWCKGVGERWEGQITLDPWHCPGTSWTSVLYCSFGQRSSGQEARGPHPCFGQPDSYRDTASKSQQRVHWNWS